jgi:hypothetical protein
MSWLTGWIGYRAARSLFADGTSRRAPEPVRNQTEEEIRADEKRFDADAKRLAAEDDAARRGGTG